MAIHDEAELRAATPTSKVRSTSAVVLLGAGILFLRGILRLWRPGLFAEDGAIFLAQAHNQGLAAIVQPYAGYLHVIPRLVAALLGTLPLTFAPVMYPAVALLLHLAMLTPALSGRLEWIIPGKRLRALLFVLLCLMLPMGEVYANVTNLIWIAGVCLLLLMLSDDPRARSARIAELAAVAILALSGLMGMFMAPWFVWRWWRMRTGHSLAMLALTTGAASIQGVILLLSDRQTSGGSIFFLPQVWARVGATWLFGHTPVLISPWRLLYFALSFAWLLGAVLITTSVLRLTAVLLWLLQLVLLAPPAMVCGPLLSPFLMQRVYVVPAAIVIVLLVAVIGSQQRVKGAVVLLVLGIGGVLINLSPAAYTLRPDLSVLQHCVDRNEPVCRQVIYDGNGDWVIELRQ
ncbi:hypothetical protein GAN17_11000 [Mycobacterium kubicae]|uniref:hypothetical protein n=1 Tax=Mycobacterium kubicae TaxID=120959 RepID=UPI001641FBA1|nr:hypothetical protein [Mycobacterium kubicae]QNI06764.1 hypothetical protein GAN17_11000 [Mycobacterium kubicae]